MLTLGLWFASCGFDANAQATEGAAKKGLQVQMVDDALALGIRHAALNFNLAQLVDLQGNTNNLPWTVGGRTFRFQRGYFEALNREVRTLSDSGVTVSLILLCYASGNRELDAVLLHPKYDTRCPNRLGAFNTQTEEGRRWFEASLEFLGHAWSGTVPGQGRVLNWIVGNEVNSHWFWANMGETTLEAFADDYLSTVRLTHQALRRQSPDARVYISLEHHWNIRYPGGTETQTFAGRPFVEYFHRRAKEGGDFDWHVAFHPYPENLFEPRTWKDASATTNVLTTPRITFRNLGLLPAYLRQPELRFEGKARRILLSEQGFHTPKGDDGERVQAAAYCYAWKQVARLEGIDAFILHRHVDHGQEGGLKLGLWSRDESAAFPAAPKSRKRIYEVFRAAGTPDEDRAFEFALPIIGLKSWEELR